MDMRPLDWVWMLVVFALTHWLMYLRGRYSERQRIVKLIDDRRMDAAFEEAQFASAVIEDIVNDDRDGKVMV